MKRLLLLGMTMEDELPGRLEGEELELAVYPAAPPAGLKITTFAGLLVHARLPDAFAIISNLRDRGLGPRILIVDKPSVSLVLGALAAGAHAVCGEWTEPSHLLRLLDRPFAAGRPTTTHLAEYAGKQHLLPGAPEEALGKTLETLDELLSDMKALRETARRERRKRQRIQALAFRLDRAAGATRARATAIFDEAHDAILILDTDGTITDASRRAEELLGRSTAALVGMNLSELVVAGERTKAIAKLHVILEQGTVRDRDLAFALPNGGCIVTDTSSSLVRKATPPFVLTILRDVTAERQAADTLQRSEAKYRTLVESSEDLTYAIDRGGSIQTIHGRWPRLEGLEERDYVGKRLGDVFAAAAKCHEEAALLALGGEPASFEWSLDSDSGRRIFVTSIFPIRSDRQGVTGAIGVQREVTARRRMQSRLMAADRMASVGTLAAGIAHEINNPLAAITGNIDFVKRTIEAEDPQRKDLVDGLDDAQQAAIRVGDIVKRLAVFSRSESAIPARLDVPELLLQTMNLAHHELKARAALDWQLDPVPPVFMSRARLAQVLLDIIVNALQSMPPENRDDNRLTIRTSSPEPHWVEILIRDNGQGIPSDRLPHVFDLFYTTRDVGIGTGLGLSMSHRIISEAGGDISISSTVGQGTDVRILLPDAQISESNRSVTVNNRLLVIDDDRAFLESLGRALASDYDVTTCAGGAEALALLRSVPSFDAVLCDVMMPEMSGPEFAQAASAFVPDLFRKLIYITGGTFMPEVEDSLSQAATPILKKPFRMAALRRLIAERLE